MHHVCANHLFYALFRCDLKIQGDAADRRVILDPLREQRLGCPQGRNIGKDIMGEKDLDLDPAPKVMKHDTLRRRQSHQQALELFKQGFPFLIRPFESR